MQIWPRHSCGKILNVNVKARLMSSSVKIWYAKNVSWTEKVLILSRLPRIAKGLFQTFSIVSPPFKAGLYRLSKTLAVLGIFCEHNVLVMSIFIKPFNCFSSASSDFQKRGLLRRLILHIEVKCFRSEKGAEQTLWNDWRYSSISGFISKELNYRRFKQSGVEVFMIRSMNRTTMTGSIRFTLIVLTW